MSHRLTDGENDHYQANGKPNRSTHMQVGRPTDERDAFWKFGTYFMKWVGDVPQNESILISSYLNGHVAVTKSGYMTVCIAG